jgi:predicted DNA-binding transcriptional regulator AlpA
MTDVPEGWVLVPIEPTKEMIKAGEKWSGLPEQTWRDMIDEALEPPIAPILIETAEAARYCGLSKQFFEKSRSLGTGPKYLKLGRRVKYRISDLYAWMADQARSKTS